MDVFRRSAPRSMCGHISSTTRATPVALAGIHIRVRRALIPIRCDDPRAPSLRPEEMMTAGAPLIEVTILALVMLLIFIVTDLIRVFG
jgi:hypothetical protein